MKRFFHHALNFILWCPYKVKKSIGISIGILWFDILRIRRKTAIANLQMCFPEMSIQEATRIARLSCWHLGRGLVEYCYFPAMDEAWVRKHVKIKGWEYFLKAQEQNKGVLLLSLHIGNGELAGSVMSALGFPVHIISKNISVKWLNDIWFDIRSRNKTQFIDDRRSTYEILKALKLKSRITFVLDQFMGPPIGVQTTFFGIPTGTAMGLALFAGKSKAPVLPIYLLRNEDESFELNFGPEIPFAEQSDREASTAYMTQKYNDVLEAIVRKNPEQWMWIHRRFKKFVVE